MRAAGRGGWPSFFAAFFDGGIALRAIIGFAGGVLMAFAARLAGGRTSGHGISGTLQLNAGSWLTVACMFISGIATAMLLLLHAAMIEPGQVVKELSEAPPAAASGKKLLVAILGGLRSVSSCKKAAWRNTTCLSASFCSRTSPP